MGRRQYIVQGPERMVGGQRFLLEDVQGDTGQPLFLQRLDQRRFIDNGATSGVHQQRRGLHPAKGLCVHQTAAALAEHQVHRQHVGLFEQFLFADTGHTDLRRAFGGEVFAPGDDAHAEHLTELRDSLADAAQTEDGQCLAMQVATQALLPLAGAQGIGLDHQVAGRGHDQRPGQFRRGVFVAVGTADLNAQRGSGFQVQGRVAHTACHQQLEFGQAPQQVFIEAGALAHHADHLEPGQALGQG
ncbi:hypothetical protein D3C75_666930 [compost metagenome]